MSDEITIKSPEVARLFAEIEAVCESLPPELEAELLMSLLEEMDMRTRLRRSRKQRLAIDAFRYQRDGYSLSRMWGFTERGAFAYRDAAAAFRKAAELYDELAREIFEEYPRYKGMLQREERQAKKSDSRVIPFTSSGRPDST